MNYRMVCLMSMLLTVFLFPTTGEPQNTAGWWNGSYQYRQQIGIKTALSTIPQNSTVKIMTKIAKNEVKEDLNDLRIIYFDGVKSEELNRIVSGVNDGYEIWFKVQKEIPAGKEDSSYFIYYGNQEEWRKPGSDPAKIFGVVEGETSGALRYQNGKFTPGVFVEEGTVNLLNNPSFENEKGQDLNWTIWSTRGEISESVVKFGKQSLLFGNGEKPAGVNVFQTIKPPEGVYTFSGWSYIPPLTQQTTLPYMCLRIWNAVNPVAAQKYFDVGKFNEWQFTSATAKTAVEKVSVSFGNNTANMTVYLDGMQLEAKPYATSFCEGSMGQGYSWESPLAAPLSASKREAATLRYPDFLNPGQGSISLWVKSGFEDNIWGDGCLHYFFDEGHLAIYKDSSNNLFCTDGVNYSSGIPVANLEKSEFYHIAAVWGKKEGLKVYLMNNKKVGKADIFTVFQPGGNMYLGSKSEGTNQANAVISDITIYDRVISEDELSAIYQGNQKPFPTESIFVTGFPDNKTTAYVRKTLSAQPEIVYSEKEKK